MCLLVQHLQRSKVVSDRVLVCRLFFLSRVTYRRRLQQRSRRQTRLPGLPQACTLGFTLGGGEDMCLGPKTAW